MVKEVTFDDLMVTVKFEVAFRQPTPTGTRLTSVGRLRRRTDGRAEAEAELLLPDVTVAASGRAILATRPAAVSSRWVSERLYWRVEEI